jgi:DNA mismatch repair protein MSH6
MGSAKRLHVGFPEKALDKNLAILVNRGHKVAVVEQTETPKQMEIRLKRENAGKKRKREDSESREQDRIVRREVCNVVSKGTFIDSRISEGYEPRWVLALKREDRTLGITFFDVSTLKFRIGQFEDDEYFSTLRTLLCQIRPIEVLHERSFLNTDLLKVLRSAPGAPVFTALLPKCCWGTIKTCT